MKETKPNERNENEEFLMEMPIFYHCFQESLAFFLLAYIFQCAHDSIKYKEREAMH